jgi:hypothetical protein
MINILAQAHVQNKTWTFTNDVPDGETISQMVLDGLDEISVNVGFIDNKPPVEFDGMSCALVVTENGIELCNIAYPETPIERTDLAYCFSYVFRAKPDSEIVISVEVTNAGQTWSDSTEIIIDPIPVPEVPGNGTQEAQA